MNVTFANPIIIKLMRYLLYNSEFQYYQYVTGNNYCPFLAMIMTQCLWVFQGYATSRYIENVFIPESNTYHHESYTLLLANLTPIHLVTLT